MSVRRWSDTLKILGVVVGILASALGSYQAAKANARTEADASYEALRQAVEHLEQNQKMVWDVVMMKSPPAPTKSFDAPAVERARPFVGMRPLPRNLEAVVARK